MKKIEQVITTRGRWERELLYEYIARYLNRINKDGQMQTPTIISKKSGWTKQLIASTAESFRKRGIKIPTVKGSISKFVEKAKIEHPEWFEKK